MNTDSREEFINRILHQMEDVIDYTQVNSFGINKIPLSKSKEFYKGMQDALVLALECLSHTELNESNPNVITYV